MNPESLAGRGAGRDLAAYLTPGIPAVQERLGYATGTTVLRPMLPRRQGSIATGAVSFDADFRTIGRCAGLRGDPIGLYRADGGRPRVDHVDRRPQARIIE